MTLHGIDLIAIGAIIAACFAGSYVLLWMRFRSALADWQLRLADQIGKLDGAIRALETRLAEHQIQTAALRQSRNAQDLENTREENDGTRVSSDEESSEIAPEIQAAVAAAAIATLGPNAAVHSVKAVPSPWTQQGRVLVQGGHNLRVPR